MVCSCGARYPDSAKFCSYCGAKNSSYQPPAVPEQPEPMQPPPPPYPGPQYNYQAQQNYQGQQYYRDQQNRYNHQSYYLDEHHERAANSAATASLVCGIIGFFIAGLILGIVAIVQGNKAKRLGYPGGKATVGVVLGVIDIIIWAIIMVTYYQYIF